MVALRVAALLVAALLVVGLTLIIEVAAIPTPLYALMMAHDTWNRRVRSIVVQRAFPVDASEPSVTLHAQSAAVAPNIAPDNEKCANTRNLQRFVAKTPFDVFKTNITDSPTSLSTVLCWYFFS